MKLLFDENLSPKLVNNLVSEYPGSTHVRNIGLKGAGDGQIWDFCKQLDYVIVSKDTDFRDRSFVEGFPPRVIWLDVGNEATTVIAELLRRERERVESFMAQPESSLLILSIGKTAI